MQKVHNSSCLISIQKAHFSCFISVKKVHYSSCLISYRKLIILVLFLHKKFIIPVVWFPHRKFTIVIAWIPQQKMHDVKVADQLQFSSLLKNISQLKQTLTARQSYVSDRNNNTSDVGLLGSNVFPLVDIKAFDLRRGEPVEVRMSSDVSNSNRGDLVRQSVVVMVVDVVVIVIILLLLLFVWCQW